MIKKAMGAVSNSPYGTAYRSRIKEPGFQLAGKTGTVQVRRITKAERETGVKKNKDLEWRERDHALFVGYAPLKNPRYAVSVVVEHGGGGSSIAAPIAKDILMGVQRRDPSRGRFRTGVDPEEAATEQADRGDRVPERRLALSLCAIPTTLAPVRVHEMSWRMCGWPCRMKT